jgi:hypothetical protein
VVSNRARYSSDADRAIGGFAAGSKRSVIPLRVVVDQLEINS